jgi:Fe-S-cluster containining protein
MKQDNRLKLFDCQRCGRCCVEIGLPYDPKIIFEMAKFLGLEVLEVIEKYYGQVTEDGKDWVSSDHKRTPCPFITEYSGTKSCAIYTVRPSGCRLYPLDTDGGRQDVDCPGHKKYMQRVHMKI